MTIPIDKLAAVQTIVTHYGCPDGIASALILRDALPGREIVWAQYGTKAHAELPATPGMLFCDMTPPRERVAEFVAAGAIVLDHHRAQRDVVEAFGQLGVFADEEKEPGVSGAMLAFREAWEPLCRPERSRLALESWHDFAHAAGIRDTWQRKHPRWREACAQAAALRFYPQASWGGPHAPPWNMDQIRARLAVGETLLEKDAERDANLIKEAHRFTVGGVRVVALNSLQTSDIADRLGEEADLVLGFHYAVDAESPRMIVSCRSRGSFSALDFAKANGGGGHRQAAGFTLPIFGDGWDPYTHLRAIVRRFIGDVP